MLTTAPSTTAVRPYRPSDAPGVRAVLEATYADRATPPRIYDWWSFGCPTASSGFMVAEIDGRLAGVQPMELFDYTDAGQPLRGAMLTGVAVHPEFRRRGVFTSLLGACEREAWKQGAAFVTSMPNERSRPGFLRAGYTDLGRRELLIRPVRPVALGAALIPIAGLLGGVALAATQALAKTPPPPGRFPVREVRQLPPETQDLVRRSETLHAGLRIRRTPDWLTWRYLAAPGRSYRLTEVIRGRDEVAGLAVTVREQRGRLVVSFLMDLLVAVEEVIESLLEAVCVQARNEGAHLVAAVVSGPRLARDLARAGFWTVPSWMPLKRFYSVAKFNPASSHPGHWHTLAGWHQTLADWDNL